MTPYFKVNDIVRHKKFGRGIVLDFPSSGYYTRVKFYSLDHPIKTFWTVNTRIVLKKVSEQETATAPAPKIALNDLAEAIRYIDGVDFDNGTKEKYLEVTDRDAADTISEALIQLRANTSAIGQVTGPFYGPKPGKPTRTVYHVNIGMLVLMTKG